MKINLASTKLALALISATLAFLILSALIPQQEVAQGQITDLREVLGSSYQIIEFLKLDQIYTAPYFYLVLGLLSLNLLFGTIVRFKTVYRVERTLLKARHLGSILFHFSLLLIIVSMIANYLYKYDGVLALTEGQRVRDLQEMYFREFQGPLEPGDYDRFGIKLEEVSLNYPVRESSAPAAKIKVWPTGSPEPKTGFVHTNKPLQVNDMEIHYGMTYGFSPELQIIDSSDNIIFKGFIRLSTRNDSGKPIFNDFYVDPRTGFHIDITVNEIEDTNLENSNLEIDANDKAISQNMLIEISKAGEVVASGVVNVGEAITVENYKVSVTRLRRWCYLNVIKNPFLDWVFAGFWLALSGMTISFIPRILPKKKKASNEHN